MWNDPPITLSVRQLLTDPALHRIPMYQRNYAWGEGEITQLIRDVVDSVQEGSAQGHPYYLGTLVVFERQEDALTVFEVIDGQQRLTTLLLLCLYLCGQGDRPSGWTARLNVDFENRPRSRRTLEAIARLGTHPAALDGLAPQDTHEGIRQGYEIIRRVLPRALKDTDPASPLSREAFARFLYEKVRIMRVKVPRDTDLNHYFEIMNNRGEQLEKHEVLKARLMAVFAGNDEEARHNRQCFNRIWEACASMDRYVQAGFVPGQRDRIFGPKDWGSLQMADFDQLRDCLCGAEEAAGDPGVRGATLAELTRPGWRGPGVAPLKEAPPERFGAVINFPNFLLQVLRVFRQVELPLDDKRLIRVFEVHLLASRSPREVKDFAFTLLRCRFLFDQYVLRRESLGGSDAWTLQRHIWREGNGAGQADYLNTFSTAGDNRRILMLLAAFHVSAPGQAYKYWLQAALDWLHARHAAGEAITEENYLAQLESVARAFVFDRHLGAGLGYDQIIRHNAGACQARRASFDLIRMDDQLTFEGLQNNLVFNYLDYLLWLRHGARCAAIQKFEFTPRSSLEHYYPRQPMPGHDAWVDEDLDCFGNLCLISHSKNSRLSNHPPEAKKSHYKAGNPDSIKQYLMMEMTTGETPWTPQTMRAHYEEIKGVLLDALDEAAPPVAGCADAPGTGAGS
ncbi:DUF262 domain-containing protein [Zoogloea sp.]|uniref:DUF262 domain-containing protein n=1 Tax=Zoogloea sp. TaxID=49181 RepID=UPI00263410FC|nr:DUF262 domain-containing protein [Zoogloea sp.]MDD3353280.1 DUF262 domain-containing protein [Zoogloea sp.]